MSARSKIFSSFAEAVRDIPDGATIGFGGFAVVGMPINLYGAVASAGRQGADLRVEFDARRRHLAARSARYGADDPERAGQKSGLRLYRADPRLAAADPVGICRRRG